VVDEPTIPTMRELAAASAAGGGLECQKCGCKDFHVLNTRKGHDLIVRYRVCRHCGEKRQTLEN
jgi:hypothetical protein